VPPARFVFRARARFGAEVRLADVALERYNGLRRPVR